MREKNYGKNVSLDRRDFFKIFGITCGAMALGTWSADIPLGFARSVYPNENITWYIPYKPGGGFDMLARAMSPYLTKYLRSVSPSPNSVSLIIKNEPAAGGRKAYSRVYSVKPDGYTICNFDLSFVTETLMSGLEFDLKKFTYLLQIGTTTRLLATGKTGFANWDEMLKVAKLKELKWGVGSFGRDLHVASIIIKEILGIPARFIALGGSAEINSALLRGDVQVATIDDSAAKPLLDAGEIRPLADFTGKSEYRDLPTLRSLGYPDLVEKVEGHRFVIGPPALPKDINIILIAAFKKVFNDQGFLSWANKSNVSLSPIYGDEASAVANRFFKFYLQDMKPTFVKYLG